MGRLNTTEALVLKTYDVGDADRFCIFLTASQGRIAVMAKGVRKLTSKLSGATQSFQHLQVDLAEHSSGMYLRSAKCISSYDGIRQNTEKFVMASRGAELLLHFLHDTDPIPSIFELAREYFSECDQNVNDLLFPTFQLKLMKELGLLPERSLEILGCGDSRKIACFCDEVLREHLSFPMRSDQVLIPVVS